MKKLGKKLSFLTKITLVVGLIISNLSSLSMVFAYEASDAVVIALNDENVLEINYTDELGEEVKAVDVKVYETYTYAGGLSEEEVSGVYSLTEEDLLAASSGTLEITYDSIFVNEEETLENFELFDGTYSVRVELVDKTVYEGEEVTTADLVLAYNTYEEEKTHDSGLNIKLFNSNDEEITQVNGKYSVTHEDSKVTVVAQILSGGLNPNDVFVYKNQEYRASELVALEFSSEMDFSGYLYGDYEIPVKVEFAKQVLVEGQEEPTTEDVVYEDNVKVLYGSYDLNTSKLNSELENNGYDNVYFFYGEEKDGLLYVLPELETLTRENTVVTRSMLDLYNFFNEVYGTEEDSVIKYELLKNDVNVVDEFVPVTEEDTIEDYLAGIVLDDTVKVVLTCGNLTITYTVVIAGDLNDDNAITEDDVLVLIDQFVGESEITNIDHSDLYGKDGEVTSLDVLYLNQVVKTQVWGTIVSEEEVTLNSALNVKFNGEALSEENYLTSGDEFTVEYVLSLTDYDVNGLAGLFSYDETLFELVSVKVANEWIGNDENGKFIYLGNESLTGPEVSEETTETEDSEVVTSLDHVVLTATFKALRATGEEANDVITLEDIELFNATEEGIVTYVLDLDTVSTDVIVVTASDDNTLSYLEVAGQKITLESGVYEYEITVSSDVTTVDLKYILSNVAAKVTATAYPEELAEGSNSVVITVESESGVVQTYTVTVIREEVVEETTTQVNYGNYYENDEENESEVIVTPGEEEPEPTEEDDEESNLSRIIIIILILLVIAGLVYLIFKDDEDEETKKANKDVNRLKKENLEPEVKKVEKVEKTTTKAATSTKTKGSSKSSTTSKTKGSKTKTTNNKKER